MSLRVSSGHSSGRYAGCIVQYVLYQHPSHLVTELWIEPQYGYYFPSFCFCSSETHDENLPHPSLFCYCEASTYAFDETAGKRQLFSEREIWEKIAESMYQADCKVIFALCSYDLLSNYVNRPSGSRIELPIALPPLSPGFQVKNLLFLEVH